jgi:protein-L-isoaspartate(D-aspartate) O-methyltransferase
VRSRGERISALIEELKRQGVGSIDVRRAIANVPRERFVSDELREEAWKNVALPIQAGQSISQPLIVALMTSALDLTPQDRVLEIGTGSGYQTAVLAELAARVFTVERFPELSSAAEAILRSLGYENVSYAVDDGSLGLPGEAPFDAIVVTAAAPSVPPALMTQLVPDGGRMVIPIGSRDDQELIKIERRGDQMQRTSLGPVRFVPLIGEQGWRDASE